MNFYDALDLMLRTQPAIIITDGNHRLSVRIPDEQTDAASPQLCIEQHGRWLATMPSTRFFETEWETVK
ncbi:hypothetical protein [Mixta calida]|uniref:hypothetical protein n=1 Tax=Mixta calida TaxID=665913 RepID=UPI0034D4B82F